MGPLVAAAEAPFFVSGTRLLFPQLALVACIRSEGAPPPPGFVFGSPSRSSRRPRPDDSCGSTVAAVLVGVNKWVKFDQVLGLCSTQFGRLRPNSGRCRPKLGFARPSVGLVRTHTIGLRSTNFGRVRPPLGVVRKVAAEVGQIRADFDQVWAMLDHTWVVSNGSIELDIASRLIGVAISVEGCVPRHIFGSGTPWGLRFTPDPGHFDILTPRCATVSESDPRGDMEERNRLRALRPAA